MWSKSNKEWIKYRKDIMAADNQSAVFLADFIRHNAILKLHTSQVEVLDLQRYRVIRQPMKVRIALKERVDVPFVFVIGKN